MKALASRIISDSINPNVVDWANRVLKEGGSAPSYKTMKAMSRFYNTLVKDSLISKIKTACVFVPDNLTAARTAIVNTMGSGSWINNNFDESDLTINGLKGNASTKFLDTGLTPAEAFTWTSAGATAYVMEAPGSAARDIGSDNSYAPAAFLFHIDLTDQDYWTIDGNASQINASNPTFLGFHSGNSLAAYQAIYKANSSTPVTVVVDTVAGPNPASGWAPWTIGVFQAKSDSTVYPSDKRMSFTAIHDGLTVTEVGLFYNAIQQVRMDLGGGYV